MTISTDPDRLASRGGESKNLPFASSDMESAGIRVTRADLARLLGCSKQAVTDWVKSGRITLGADDRIDPRQAIRSLLATGDPARLRARILAPLVSEMDQLRKQVATLQAELARARDDADLYEGATAELQTLIESLQTEFGMFWGDLAAMPTRAALLTIERWIEHSQMYGPPHDDQCILDFQPSELDTSRQPKFSEEAVLSRIGDDLES